MSVTCPIDHKDDMIQSVPALVLRDRASGTFSGPSGGITYIDGKYGYTSGYTNLYGSFTTDTARALAAPFPPKEVRFWSLVGWSFLYYLGICAIFIGAVFVWRSFKNSLVKNPDVQKKVFTPGLSFACIALGWIGWHPMMWPLVAVLKKKLNERLNYPLRYQRWREAYAKWNDLYYCHRCGIFFNPVTNEHYPPNQLYNYLRISEFE